jgi:hypothetical protein
LSEIKPLPNWSEIKQTHPELADKLRRNQNDYDSIKEYLKITLGATEVSEWQ